MNSNVDEVRYISNYIREFCTLSCMKLMWTCENMECDPNWGRFVSIPHPQGLYVASWMMFSLVPAQCSAHFLHPIPPANVSSHYIVPCMNSSNSEYWVQTGICTYLLFQQQHGSCVHLTGSVFFITGCSQVHWALDVRRTVVVTPHQSVSEPRANWTFQSHDTTTIRTIRIVGEPNRCIESFVAFCYPPVDGGLL